MAKDKNDKCQINLKNMDCELLDWYRKAATEKNRSLNQHILYILRRHKQYANCEIYSENYPLND